MFFLPKIMFAGAPFPFFSTKNSLFLLTHDIEKNCSRVGFLAVELEDFNLLQKMCKNSVLSYSSFCRLEGALIETSLYVLHRLA